MSHSIHASPRFTFIWALVIMVGLYVAELGFGGAVTHGFVVFFGAAVGANFANAGAIEATLLIVTKLLACFAITDIALHYSRERWQNLGHLSLQSVTLAVAFIPIVAAVTIFLSEFDNLLRFLLPPNLMDGWNFAPDLDSLVSASWQGPVLAVVVAPVTEEIIFRGVILRGLLGRWPAWAAIAVSAVLFAVMHMNPAQTPIALGLGAILGWVYVRTRSLGLCMLGHALNNASSYPVDFLPFEIDGFNHAPDGVPPEVAVFHPWWFDLTGIALFVGGLWIIHRFAPAQIPWRHAEPPLLGPVNTNCQR